MQPRRLIDSFSSAFKGLTFVFKTQRNMRLHILIALGVILFGLVLKMSLLELVILIGIIGLVFLAEIFNTAVEVIIDLVSQEYHHLAERAKDITAGAVLTSSIMALVVGTLIFVNRLSVPIENGINCLRTSSWHLTLLCLLLVGLLVVLIKFLLRRGTPLKGGMPSGHSALAFSIWALVSLVSRNALVTILVLPLAVVIASDRITRKTHNFWEVSAGGLLGFLVALLLVQIFR